MTAHNDEFSTALLESMDDAIRSLLSQDVLDAFHSNLVNKQSISLEEIPDQLPTISIVLKKYFGPSADTIERAIAQRLYSKCGLEFQKNVDYQLTDYVEKARNKLGSSAVEPTNVNLPLRDDFDRLFLVAVQEAIEEALGKDQAKLAFRFIERDVPFAKLPHHLPTFYSALKRNFGKDSGTIELSIARKLYQKLSVEFIETPNAELGNYVELALVKLSQREQLGFVNISARL